MHYLDNAATTPVHPAVVDTICGALRSQFGNPSSLYACGGESQRQMEGARIALAKLCGCKPKELYFTGCGSESNNLAVQGALKARKAWGRRIVTTGFEHPSVQNQMDMLAEEGWEIVTIPPDSQEHIDEQRLLGAVNGDTALVTFMQVNNEVGTVLPVNRWAAEIKKRNPRTAVHVDAIQALGKIPLQLSATAIDSCSFSAHKIHGPKGIGLLYLRSGFHFSPPFRGGGQERGIRPGTENLPYILGFAVAAKSLVGQETARTAAALELRNHLQEGLAQLPDIVWNSPQDATPFINNFSVMGYRSEVLLHFLERYEVQVSSGSACSKGAASHTLTAMGLPKPRVDSALRVSFSDETTKEDIDALLAGIAAAQKELLKVR